MILADLFSSWLANLKTCRVVELQAVFYCVIHIKIIFWFQSSPIFNLSSYLHAVGVHFDALTLKPDNGYITRHVLCSKLSSHYFQKATNQLAVLMTEC